MHKISKLKNGITLIKVPLKGSKAVTVMAMFPVGSRYEHKKISGISHFVEHMMFKGTKTIGTKNYNKEDKILRLIAKAGKNLDAERMKGQCRTSNPAA